MTCRKRKEEVVLEEVVLEEVVMCPTFPALLA